MATPRDRLTFFINHVVLPPCLPHEEDPDPERSENALLQLVHEQIISFVRQSSVQDADLWRPVQTMFASWRKCLIRNGAISTQAVQDTLSGLQLGGK